MIILSKLADYGVIVATHLAADPERQMTAAALAKETSLPRATVAKVLKALAHAGIVAGARGAAGGYRLARDAAAISVVAGRGRDRRHDGRDAMHRPWSGLQAHPILPDAAALAAHQ